MFYDQETDLSVLACLVQHPMDFASKKNTLRKLRFTSEKVRKVFSWMVEAHDKHKEFPTETEMRELIKKKAALGDNGYEINLQEFELIVDNAFHKDITGMTKDNISMWLIEQQRDVMAEKLSQVPPEKMAEALKLFEAEIKTIKCANFNQTDFGHSPFSNAGISKTLKMIEAYNNFHCIPTGYKNLDLTLAGGVRKGEVSIVVGTTGLGKTTTLLNLARGHMVAGNARVLYVYLDSMEEDMGKRWSECWLGKELYKDYDKIRLERELEDATRNYENKIVFKCFPAKSIDMPTLSKFIEDVKAYYYVVDKNNNWPEEKCGQFDVLMLDYMNMMSFSGTGANGEANFEVNEERSQELNGIATTHNLAVWTAHQGGTQAMDIDEPTMKHAQGYKAIFNPIANVFMLGCPREEKKKDTRMFTMGSEKIRRPGATLNTLYFIMCTKNQRIDEDPDRQPIYSQSKENAPKQDKFQVTGEAVEALEADALIAQLS